MDAASVVAALNAVVSGGGFEAAPATDQPTIVVPRDRLLDAARALRDRADLGFDVLVDVAAVDWWPAEPRFEVVYHLVSTGAPAQLRVKVRLAGEDPRVPTLRAIWASAGWLEREVWDLSGIVFDGHGDLRRLMMPEDWEGHPLRKDHPVQIRMKPKVYEPLQLTAREFAANIAADRDVRGGSKPGRPPKAPGRS